jgi:hypothetical protein
MSICRFRDCRNARRRHLRGSDIWDGHFVPTVDGARTTCDIECCIANNDIHGPPVSSCRVRWLCCCPGELLLALLLSPQCKILQGHFDFRDWRRRRRWDLRWR